MGVAGEAHGACQRGGRRETGRGRKKKVVSGWISTDMEVRGAWSPGSSCWGTEADRRGRVGKRMKKEERLMVFRFVTTDQYSIHRCV